MRKDGPAEEKKSNERSSDYDDSSINMEGNEINDSEYEFVQWLSRLLLENQRQLKNEPIKNFTIRQVESPRNMLTHKSTGGRRMFDGSVGSPSPLNRHKSSSPVPGHGLKSGPR